MARQDNEAKRLAQLRADLAELRAKGASKEVVDYYIRTRHPQRTAEQELAAMPSGAPSRRPAALEALGATLGGVMSAIPGGKAFTAAAMVPLRGGTFRENVGDIERAVAELPLISRAGSGLLGGLLSGGALTKAPVIGRALATPAKAGAAYGAAERGLDPSSGETAQERALATALGGTVGAVGGKAFDWLGRAGIDVGQKLAVGKTAISTPTAARQKLNIKDVRSARAGRNYPTAISAAQRRQVTQPVLDILDDPYISPIVARIRQSGEFEDLAPESPEMLDRVFKALSSREGQLRKSLSQAEPADRTFKDLDLGDVISAKGRVLQAMESVDPKLGASYMPEYRKAVDDFAEYSAKMKAVGQGSSAVKSALALTTPEAGLTSRSPEAYEQLVRSLPPDLRRHFVQGALGEAGQLVRTGAAPKGALDLTVYPVLRRTYRPLGAAQRMMQAAGTVPVRTPPAVGGPATVSLLDLLRRQER